MEKGIIRQANSNDCIQISVIYNNYISAATMDTEMRSESYFSEMLALFDSRECILVHELGEKIIGWGSIKKYSFKEGYKYAAETSVFLHPDQRSKGYGKQLKIAVIEKARHYGYKHLVAKIWANNQRSIQYNVQLGYTIVGTQKQVGFINGEWIDVVILQYLIE